MEKFTDTDRAFDEMPTFTLMACDDLAIYSLEAWRRKAYEAGTSKEKMASFNKRLNEMREWRKANPDKCKMPD